MFDNLKEKVLKFITSRAVIISGVLILFACVLICKLFVLQIVEGKEHRDSFVQKQNKEKTISATRGRIFDRQGKLLAHDEPANSVMIEDVFDAGKQRSQQINDTLCRVIDLIEMNDDTIDLDGFGISMDVIAHKFVFSSEKDKERKKFLRDVYGHVKISELEEDEKNSTPLQVIDYLCKRYEIGETKEKNGKSIFVPRAGYSDEMAFKLVVIRYKMTTNGYQKYLGTTIASNVNDKTVAAVKENLDTLKGISVEMNTMRMYEDPEVFSPILGYTGKINVDELDKYSQINPEYNMNDIVGKSGIEQSMESELQGKKGYETVSVDNTGKVIQVTDHKDPVAGKDVYLTIDKDLNIACYNIIEKRLASIITDKLTTAMTDPNAKPSNSSDVKISIFDVYFGLFDNNVIDISHFSQADAKNNEKTVYEAFKQKKQSVITALNEELVTKKTPFNKLSGEYKEYINHIVSNLYEDGIITPDKKTDLYNNWAEGTISLSEYISGALSQQWIDASKLALEDQYVDSDDTFNAIVNYIFVGKESKGANGTIKQYGLNDDHVFDTSLYKYMIYTGGVTGAQICNILLEQGIVNSDNINPEELQRWKNGGNPFEFMKNRIANRDITPAQLAIYPSTASMVITDVNTGDVLALVSYPGYDNNRMANGANAEYYAKLMNDKSKPMFNYATMDKSVPGSTFKIVSATAGLMEGAITTTQTLPCSGIFMKLGDGHPPKCWKGGGHGSLNVVGGIRNSCNVFFYEVGYRLGFNRETNKYDSDLGCEKLKKYAALYGLTEKSGVEIEEHTPSTAKDDAVRGAIGQDKNSFTTVGLARYVTTVANSGTCYNLTLVDKIKDQYDNVEERNATIKDKIDMKSAYWDVLHLGMRQVVMDKAYYAKLNNAGIPVAGKTGTAQTSEHTPNHSLFIGYAPYDKPQIAVATRIDYGYTSSYAAQITKDVLECYFKITSLDEILSDGEHLQDGAANGD